MSGPFLNFNGVMEKFILKKAKLRWCFYFWIAHYAGGSCVLAGGEGIAMARH